MAWRPDLAAAAGGALPRGRRSPLRAGLGLEGALAPKPGGPGGGEPIGLPPIQNLEAGGDRESPKLMQVS